MTRTSKIALVIIIVLVVSTGIYFVITELKKKKLSSQKQTTPIDSAQKKEIVPITVSNIGSSVKPIIPTVEKRIAVPMSHSIAVQRFNR